ncbi:MAG: patatin-like phospholipase family protein [Acidimicrobiia bacterium]|nr:patatin-like phospholipase family protein [Acidimicrobiia bacterium]
MGLVLGAGGPVGHAFHAGTLGALADAGWDARRAELIVGTSIGAVTGALMRADVPPADLYARVTGEVVSNDSREKLAAATWATVMCDLQGARTPIGLPASPRLFLHLVRRPWRTRAGLLLAAVTPSGPVSVAPVAKAFNTMLGGAWPDRPLRVCAVDLDTGERVVLGRDEGPPSQVGAAIAASTAAPALFEPVVVDGHRLVDGGLHSPANADVIGDAVDDLDAVVVSAPMGIGSSPGRWGADLPGRALNHWTTWRELRRVRDAGVPVVVFEPDAALLELMHYNAFDLTSRAEIARRAYEMVAARPAGGGETASGWIIQASSSSPSTMRGPGLEK